MNSIKLKSAVATAILTLSAIQSVHRVAVAQPEIVAISGDAPVAGNGTFSTFGVPSLTDNNLAFTATLTGTIGGSSDNQGIYRFLTDSLIRIPIEVVRTGQPAPDGNGLFSNLLPPTPPLGPKPTFDGGITFRAQLTNTSGVTTDTDGIFHADGTTLTQIVRTGQPSPDGVGTFHQIMNFNQNRSGKAVFGARFRPAFPGIKGVFLGSGGPITQIAGVPGVDPSYFGPLGPMGINGSEFVAFQGSFGGGLSLLLGSIGPPIQIVRSRQPAPDGNGTFTTILSDGQLSINSKQQMAFVTELEGTSGGVNDNIGLFLGDGELLVQIAREGQVVPDGNGLFSNLRLRGGPSVDRIGRVAFLASLFQTSGGTSDDEGLFFGFGTNIQVVRKGEPAPDGDGTFFQFQDFALNGYGQGNLAFKARLTGTSAAQANDEGIFLASGNQLLQVVREGDPLAGSTITALALNGSEGPNGDVGSGLSFAGDELTYRATLADGRQAIVLHTIADPPPPGDFDLDGDIDGRDFLEWQRGHSILPLSPEDLQAWLENYGIGSQGGGDIAVPEPAAFLLWLAASGVLLLRFSRRFP